MLTVPDVFPGDFRIFTSFVKQGNYYPLRLKAMT